MKKNKLIKGLDNDIYNDFVSVCHKQDMTIAEKLNVMMHVETIMFQVTKEQQRGGENVHTDIE